MIPTHDDPRVTAYVFGELPSDQLADFETELRASIDLQQEVASVRDAVKALEGEFASQGPSMSDDQRNAVETAIQQSSKPSQRPVALAGPASSPTAVSATGSASHVDSSKRIAIVAVLAAVVLLMLGLTSPYWLSPAGHEISMTDESATMRSAGDKTPGMEDVPKDKIALDSQRTIADAPELSDEFDESPSVSNQSEVIATDPTSVRDLSAIEGQSLGSNQPDHRSGALGGGSAANEAIRGRQVELSFQSEVKKSKTSDSDNIEFRGSLATPHPGSSGDDQALQIEPSSDAPFNSPTDAFLVDESLHQPARSSSGLDRPAASSRSARGPSANPRGSAQSQGQAQEQAQGAGQLSPGQRGPGQRGPGIGDAGDQDAGDQDAGDQDAGQKGARPMRRRQPLAELGGMEMSGEDLMSDDFGGFGGGEMMMDMGGMEDMESMQPERSLGQEDQMSQPFGDRSLQSGGQQTSPDDYGMMMEAEEQPSSRGGMMGPMPRRYSLSISESNPDRGQTSRGFRSESRSTDSGIDPAGLADLSKTPADDMTVESLGVSKLAENDFEMGMTDSLALVDESRERFARIHDNPFLPVSSAPQSTFSIDVDTASYAKMRVRLKNNSLPNPSAVRIEELVNYFDYDYPAPKGEHPFEASMQIAQCPWNTDHRLARIGIQAQQIDTRRPASNLVFLLDVSGSMNRDEKLPLMIQGMKMLTDQLTEDDQVAIVVYAGAAGLVLDSTNGDRKQSIVSALDRLRAGGSTNGGQGIQLAYEIARDNFIVGGTNRVILCTDGDFNVGVTGTEQLVELAKRNAKTNVFLTILGFGQGNDAMMEKVSNSANGNYSFIDSEQEAHKVLVEQLGGTLVTVAKDVKIQIEFNPSQISAYRLIGYENRLLNTEDFADDTKDAGEIGAGHTVTALYELVPAQEPTASPQRAAGAPSQERLRYQRDRELTEHAESDEALILKLRYKKPDGDKSRLMTAPIPNSNKGFLQADRDFRFAAAVAGFGMLLRDSAHRGNWTFKDVLAVASDSAKGDDFGYRTEFVELVKKAAQLAPTR